MVALAVLGYSVATVVDLVCSATLLAVCLLDEILVDLTCKLYLFDEILVDIGWSVSYATIGTHMLDEIFVNLACELCY